MGLSSPTIIDEINLVSSLKSKITNGGEIEYWVLKKYIFDTLVMLELLYGAEVWGWSIPKFTYKDFENFQNHSLSLSQSYKNPYMLLLKYGLLPTEIMFMEKAIEYMLKVKKLAHWLAKTTRQ